MLVLNKIFLSEKERSVSVEDTHKKIIAVSNHDGGERDVFLEFDSVKNVFVDFGRSVFGFKNRITPILLSNCKNVTLKNFTIKFDNRYYLQTEIAGFDGEFLVLKPFSGEDLSVENGKLIIHYENERLEFKGRFFVQEFEKQFKVARNASIKIYSADKNRFRYENGALYMFCEDRSSFNVGNFACLFCEPRTADAILIDNCENIVLENVTIFSSPSMGVMCQLSKNVTLKDVKVVKEKGSAYDITTLADATHFFACRGKITIDGCTFINMNDDAVNVHGIYQAVISVGTGHIVTEMKHAQQFGVNSYKNGDIIAISDNRSKSIKRKVKVISSEKISENTFRIKVGGTAGINAGDLAENLSAYPEIFILRTATGNNRPRGFLLSSRRKTVVKNCEFYNSECGIGIFADSDFWYESGAVKNVVIKNNKFRCNYGGGESAIDVFPSVNSGKRFFNKKIVIKNNSFDLSYGRAIRAENTERVTVKNNVYLNIQIKNGENLYRNCKTVIEKNNE